MAIIKENEAQAVAMLNLQAQSKFDVRFMTTPHPDEGDASK
jgi:hypothetical protein